MKKVLIISPNFPPVNAADMHRVRQSLPYFEEMGWKSTVVAVEPAFVEMGIDNHLEETLPENTEIIRLKAFNPSQTRKFGLGNLGLRVLWHLYRWGEKELPLRDYDLVYFSTTAFPVMVLGRHWKKKFNIPYIIDMQDPWRNDYYLNVPKKERPPKFKLAYTLDKWMEAWTMKNVDGIVSVSPAYPRELKNRYSNIDMKKSRVIPFGGASIDFDILDRLQVENSVFSQDDPHINVVYVGRGGHDMDFSARGFFRSWKKGLETNPELFSKIRAYFVGTSYARNGKGKKTIEPLANVMGLKGMVKEITDRVPYFEALNMLRQADLLFVPGSMDDQYTASKLYPYILAKRPFLAAFHDQSSVVKIIRKTGAGRVVTFNENTDPESLAGNLHKEFCNALEEISKVPNTNWEEFEPYTAKEMTKKQVELFNEVIS